MPGGRLAHVGGTTLYDVADIPLLLVHTDVGIRAYHNSCLHRGRPLDMPDDLGKQWAPPAPKRASQGTGGA